MSLSPLAFSPRNAAVLAFWTRSSRATSGPAGAPSSVDPAVTIACYVCLSGAGIRGICNHGQRYLASTAASSESDRCNVQRPARGTGDKWIQRAILQKRHATMAARRRRPPERCSRTRSQRSGERSAPATRKTSSRCERHALHHTGSSASRSGTPSTWATTSTTRSSRMR